MRHRKRVKKLQRTGAHKRALLRNLACSLFEHGKIETTRAKAKELVKFAERLITLGKENTLHTRRKAIAYINNKEITKKIFEVIAPRYNLREGGCIRILPAGYRIGDSAQLVVVELVD